MTTLCLQSITAVPIDTRSLGIRSMPAARGVTVLTLSFSQCPWWVNWRGKWKVAIYSNCKYLSIHMSDNSFWTSLQLRCERRTVEGLVGDVYYGGVQEAKILPFWIQQCVFHAKYGRHQDVQLFDSWSVAYLAGGEWITTTREVGCVINKFIHCMHVTIIMT